MGGLGTVGAAHVEKGRIERNIRVVRYMLK
jgi:hypothetical protein